MQQVGSQVVSSASVDNISDRMKEEAAKRLIYGSLADEVAGVNLPRAEEVALAAGATTCGHDRRWAAALQCPATKQGDI